MVSLKSEKFYIPWEKPFLGGEGSAREGHMGVGGNQAKS